jgi:hypothetical protein
VPLAKQVNQREVVIKVHGLCRPAEKVTFGLRKIGDPFLRRKVNGIQATDATPLWVHRLRTVGREGGNLGHGFILGIRVDSICILDLEAVHRVERTPHTSQSIFVDQRFPSLSGPLESGIGGTVRTRSSSNYEYVVGGRNRGRGRSQAVNIVTVISERGQVHFAVLLG